MERKSVKLKSAFRMAAVAVFAAVLGGCSTYYQSYYPDSGVYYGDAGAYDPSFRGSAGYSRGVYDPVNPVVYPYWSIDYFYFSQFYHPYSVYVGYNEPLYYPYPGWSFGYHHPIRSRASLAFGFGYPWHGSGYRYPAYSFGFFSSYDPFHVRGRFGPDRHGHHRIRQIDRRLKSLQQGDDRYWSRNISRSELVGRDRVAGGGRSGLQDSRNGTRNRADVADVRSRAGLLQNRDSAPFNAPDDRIERRAPNVRTEPRSDRRPALRSKSRPDRRVLDRDQIRRRDNGRKENRRSASEGHRGIPIDSLRGRVIVNSRNSRADEAPGRGDATRRERPAGAAQNIRRVPATERNRGERRSRQAPAQGLRRADKAARGNLLNGSTGNISAPPRRPDRRAAPSSRPSRDTSRPEPPSRTLSPSRRALMHQRSSNDGGGARRDARTEKAPNKRRDVRKDSRHNSRHDRRR